MTEDWTLLQEYVRSGSQPAFTELVKRYANLVYGCGLRQTADMNEADDVSQATFLVLARRAKEIRAGTPLGGWLFNVARLSAANLRRVKGRRQKRETEALAMQSASRQGEVLDAEITLLLDDAVASLSIKERDAIVLRFYGDKSIGEVGRSLGISEDAAAQRISRAVAHLRDWLRTHGVGVSETVLAASLPIELGHAAPAQLLGNITRVACNLSPVSKLAADVSTGVIRSIAGAKAKVVGIWVVGILLLCVLGGVAVHRKFNSNVPITVVATPRIDQSIRLTFSHPGTAVLKAAISGYGRRALTGGGLPFNEMRTVHTEIRLWDLSSGKELLQLHGHTGKVTGLRFTGQDQQAISTADDGTARLWDLNDGQQIREFDAQLPIADMCISPDGKTLLTGARVLAARQYASIADPSTQTLRLWDIGSGTEIARFGSFTRGVSHVAWSDDGRYLAAALDPPAPQILIWDLNQASPFRITLVGPLLSCLIFTPDGNLVGGFKDGTVQKWDVASGVLLRKWKAQDGEIFAMVYSPDRQVLVSAGGNVHVSSPGNSTWSDCLLHVFDARSGQELYRWGGHETGVYSLGFSSDGKQLLSAGGQRVCVRSLSGD